MNASSAWLIFLFGLIGLSIWMIVSGSQEQNSCNDNEYDTLHCGTVSVTSLVSTEPESDSNCLYANTCGTWSFYTLSNGCVYMTLNQLTINGTFQFCRDGDTCYIYEPWQTAPGCSSGLLISGCILLVLSFFAVIFICVSTAQQNTTPQTTTTEPRPMVVPASLPVYAPYGVV
jgi:hypothetical protein